MPSIQTVSKMVVDQASILNIMGGMESTAGVRLHNHRRKLRQRFDIIKKLGQGTYGKVQLGINKETGQEVAIKTIKKSKIESEADLIRIRREIQIMSSVQHPNIIHIYEVFENREKMVLVMEYAAGGELYDFLSERKVLSEEEARRLFRQIATAVYYCHKHKICHRDLKLENILLDENGSAKIADFGLSNVFDETRLLGTFCGSPLYASPEIVQGTPYHGPEVDCWSLGVLLYTLVYGAMPFDGSNFKRLVKQISQGDYFEPKKPSPASPLIRDMLTVSPNKRADIGKICSHWWVNEGHSESCLEIAEHLANQTPVRLDLLLSLAPPMSADKVVVTKDQEGNGQGTGAMAEGPVRSHSVGSLMDLDQPSAERRIRDFVNSTKADASRANVDKVAETSKRKLEDGVSTEDASVGGAKKKERSRSKQRSSRSDRRSSSRSRKQEVMDVESDTLSRSDSKELVLAAANAINQILGDSPATDTSSEKPEEKKKSVKGKPRAKAEDTDVAREDILSPEASVAEGKSGSEPSQEATVPVNDVAATDESTKGKVKRKKKIEEQPQHDQSSASVSEKLSDTSPSDESVRSVDEVNGSEGVGSIISSSTAPVSLPLNDSASLDKTQSQGKISLSKILTSQETPVAEPARSTSEEAEPPRLTERRKSKIFETAEKFNYLASTERKGSIVEKPKKIHIPGVKVSDAKAAFERKSSVTSSTASVPTTVERKGSVTTVPAAIKNSMSKKAVQVSESKSKVVSDGVPESMVDELAPQPDGDSHGLPEEGDRAKKLKEAVGVISSVIEGQVTGRRVSLKKPPKLNSFDSSRGGTPSVPGTPLSPTGVDPNTGMKTVRVQVAPNDIRLATIQVSTPQATKYPDEEPPLGNQAIESSAGPEEDQPKKASSSMEITLKSATLPRRKTSKAEIQMGTPPAKPSSPEKLERMIQAPPSPGRRASVGQPLGGYRSEVEHIVGAADHPNRPRHQRSEVSFPVAAASSSTRVHPMPFRSASCEPESSRPKPREHIIPIRLEGEDAPAPRTSTPPAKPPVPPTASGNLPYQRTLSQLSQRSNSLSRQSTQDSDTESTISQTGGEPIRKSPREYIIPIAVEGGGYVTPRATSLEPSEDSRASTHSLPRSRFSRTKRMSSLLSESEDEGPFAALHRHSSIGRDSDNEDRPSSIHLHRLRSSRPMQRTLEHADSVSSAEEEDDDEGFEILTAENLFSSLLSRVRSLTQRLNVEDGGRPGFPSSRLLSQFPSHAGSRASPFMFPSSILSRGSPFEPLSRLQSGSSHRTVTTTFTRVSETSRSFSRNDSESGSVGPTPWRRSISRDVSDSDSIYSESHNSGNLPRGSSESSSLSSYSLTPGLASRLAQYQQSDAQTPAPERRLARAYMKSRSAGVPPIPTASPSMNDDDGASSTPGVPNPSPCPIRRYSSARRAARALEEELNGLDIPMSYLPTPTTTTLSRSVDENSARRLGLGRTLSMRERPASPSSSSGYYQRSGLIDTRGSRTGLGLGSTSTETYSWERPSSTLSPRRRPYAYTSSLSDSGATGDYRRSYLESPSEKELPPLPYLSRRAGVAVPDRSKRPADTSEEDCTYYEILPYHRKEVARPEPSSDTLTRSCPSAAFLSEVEPLREPLREPVHNKPEVLEPGGAPSVPRHYRSVSVTRELGPSAGLSSVVPGDPLLPSGEPTGSQLRRSLSSVRSEPGSDRSILGRLFRPSSVASTSTSELLSAKPKARRVSRFLRPDFFDTPREESVYAKEKDMQKAAEQQQQQQQQQQQKKAMSPPEETSKKSSSSSSSKASSRFLQSLERKLERLRGGPSTPAAPATTTLPAATVSTGPRIESTIRSLREQSLEPKESDAAPTESSLLKRAVSVSDVGHLDKATPNSGGSSMKTSGRLFGLFRKDPADVSKGLIPTFRTQRAYSGSQSDSLVLEAPRDEALGSVSVDVSIVLPRPGKAGDKSISSSETEAASIPSGIAPTLHQEPTKTDADLKPPAAGGHPGESVTRTSAELLPNGKEPQQVPASSDVSAETSVEPETKRSKTLSKSKSDLKEKGLSSSKSKSKVPKLKKESSSKAIESDSVKCDAKGDEFVNGVPTLMAETETTFCTTSSDVLACNVDVKKNDRLSLELIEFDAGIANETSSPKKSTPKHKVVGSCDGIDIKTSKDSSQKSISPSKLASRSKLVKEDSAIEVVSQSSISSAGAKNEKNESSAVKSNSLIEVSQENSLSTSPELTKAFLQPKQSECASTSAPKSLRSKLNGGLNLKSPSKTKINLSDDLTPQDQPPVKSSSRSKTASFDDARTLPVKSGSRTKLSSASPLKSASKSKLLVDEESSTKSVKDKEMGNSSPLKLSSFVKQPITDKQEAKTIEAKAPSPDKPAPRAKVPGAEERHISPTKSTSKQDLRTALPLKSSSKTRIPGSEEKSASNTFAPKPEARAPLPVKSSSRSRITASEERSVSRTAVSKPETKTVPTVKSSSKTNIPREKDVKGAMDSKESSNRDIPKGDDKRSSPSKSGSTTTEKVIDSSSTRPTSLKEDIPIVPPSKSPSKGRLLKSASPARTLKSAANLVKSSSKSGLLKDEEKTVPVVENTSSRVSKSFSGTKIGQDLPKATPPSKSSSKSKIVDSENKAKLPAKTPSSAMMVGEGSPSVRPVKTSEGSASGEEEVRSTARALKKTIGNELSPGRRAASSSPSGPPTLAQGIPRRVRARSARPGAPRSSSQSRSTTSEENVPVVSLKDVERRHREMLLDKWSKSLQTLHMAKKEVSPLPQQQKEETSPAHGPLQEAAAASTPSDETKPSKPPRPALHLDLSSVSSVPTPVVFRAESPAESESLDSWSVCSADYADGRDLATVSPTYTPLTPTAEESESVSDRIRRKSFYCRFNDIKKKRKPSSSSSSLGLSGSVGSPLTNPSGRTRGYSSDYGSQDTPRRGSLRRSPVLDEYTPAPVRRPAMSPTSCSPSAASLSPGHVRGNSLKYLHNGRPTSPLMPSAAPMDRSPTWDKSGIELKNDLMFHSLGLHRFDPGNLTVSRDRLFEMLSPPPPASPSLLTAEKPTAPVERLFEMSSPAPVLMEEATSSMERPTIVTDADPGTT